MIMQLDIILMWAFPRKFQGIGNDLGSALCVRFSLRLLFIN